MIQYMIGWAGSEPFGKLREFLFLLLLVVAGAVTAQVDNVYVYGTVKDYSTSKRLDGVTVSVFKDGTRSNSVVTSANGKYEFNLDYGYEYKIAFDKAGMVGKNVVIDTRGIPDEERVGGIAMNVEMTLIQEIAGIDYSILKEPFGKSKYDGAEGMLSWDLAYTEQMRAAQNRLMKEYDELRKKEANADAAYKKAMDQGNAAMDKKDYKRAVGAFTDALNLKEGDPVATARLSDAQMRLGEQEQAANMEKQYTDLIKEADGLFNKKSYEEAKAKYQAALQVKDGERYPAQRIKECDSFIADLAAKAEADRLAKELNDKYNAAVAAGDAAFKAARYDEARTQYTEAAGLKPDEKYPPQQLAAIVAKEAELAQKAEEERLAKELDEAYQAAIQAGDAAFNKAEYEAARTGYNQALDLKPKERYPQQQLAAIDKKLAELAKKEEEERQAAEREAAYQAVIAEADAAFQGEQYEEARTKYNEALGIKPKEKYPTDQLAAITKRLADLAKKEEEERKAAELEAQYQAAIAEADGALQGEDFDRAKKKYNEALGLKPKEKYPTDQLDLIARTLAEKARQAEEERQAAERDARYLAFVDKGEEFLGKESYQEAKAQFQEALKVKPGEALPKERIVEIDAIMDQLAREAEARRKQQELDAKYDKLIASADSKFGSDKFADALNDYKDAAQLKPDEQHPQDRIAAINDLLDAKAKEAAEKERLAREAAEKDRQYNEYIAQADRDFKAKAYQEAARGYGSALDVKPGERHPTERLAEIQGLLEAQAAAEMDKAAREAAERARLEEEARLKAEADSLRAAQEAAERERQEAERRERERTAADQEASYQDAITMADAAFRNRAWDLAREGYNEALGIKPGERYPKDQLTAIEKAIADQQRAERDALAQADAERLAMEERMRREAEEADALERARREREAQRALDDRFAGIILNADQAMGDKDYSYARELYTQALDIKPDETYPQLKIEQIEKLLLEQENQRRRQEQAERRRQEAPPPVAHANHMDNRKEQEAEEFMREAREREEAEKYERIKRLRMEEAQLAAERDEKAEARHGEAGRHNAELASGMTELYHGGQAQWMRNMQDVEAMKAAQAQREREWQQRGRQATGQARSEAQDKEADIRQRHISMDRDGKATGEEAVAEQQRDWANFQATMDERGRARSQQARDEALATEEERAHQEDRYQDKVAKNHEDMEAYKQSMEARHTLVMAAAQERQTGNRASLSEITPNQERSFDDYARSELASQYPQGVTEESYTEGNKVIIRRVLVQGNKADEYSKVIAKWGTFYFKNGLSITEHIWTVNTER